MLIITIFALYGAVIAMGIVVYLLCDEIRKLKKRQKRMKRRIEIINRDICASYAKAVEAQNKAAAAASIVRSLVDSPINGRHVRNEDDQNEQH